MEFKIGLVLGGFVGIILVVKIDLVLTFGFCV